MPTMSSLPPLWFALCLPPVSASSSPPEALACWAGRFTPRVVLLPADGILAFEVAASLRLFGGLDQIITEIRSDLESLVPDRRLALAATPLAATWLARLAQAQGVDILCTDAATTRAALERLPIAILGLPPPLQRRLDGFGIGRLGQAMALPRAGLGRRLGAGFILDLARALGEVPHPQANFPFPEGFAAGLELPAPVDAAPILAFAARRLLAPLGGWLAARQLALREIRWLIDHGHGHVTAMPLAFSQPVHAVAPIERVLHERLASFRLPAPALGLRLEVEQHEARSDHSGALFDGTGQAGEALAGLMDRLAARLGPDAVKGLAPHADHRPEWASRQMRLGENNLGKVGADEATALQGGRANNALLAVADGGTAITALPRPLWLADPVEALPEVQGRPQRRGFLRLLAGPERIETGWWDGAPARRDYFIAIDTEGAWLWIYRDPRHAEGRGGWFLHGWFA